MPRTHGHMLQMHICTTSTACGASPPCTAFRMSAVAGETGVFLLLQFIHVLRLADKKYSTISFIFYGPLAEWALSVQQASSACLHACVRTRPCVGGLKLPVTGEMLPPSPFLISCSLWGFARITWLPHDLTGGPWITVPACLRRSCWITVRNRKWLINISTHCKSAERGSNEV